MLMGVTLLFGKRVAQAAKRLEAAPYRALGVGVALALTVGVIAIGMLSQPRGLGKLMGWVLS